MGQNALKAWRIQALVLPETMHLIGSKLFLTRPAVVGALRTRYVLDPVIIFRK